MRLVAGRLFVVWLLFTVSSVAQQKLEEPYSRKHTYSAFAEYANDSSHIIRGVAPSRKIGAVGLQYERRLLDRPRFRLGYAVELRPLILESDPASFTTQVRTGASAGTFVESPYREGRCAPDVHTYTGTINDQPFTDVVTTTCGRLTTFAEALSPIGFRLNLLPRRRMQITMSSNGGYMFSAKKIPTDYAGAFNFTFEFGAGVEYFYAAKRSVRMEYQVQHYSNYFTADSNPGVDSGFVKLTYAFGR